MLTTQNAPMVDQVAHYVTGSYQENIDHVDGQIADLKAAIDILEAFKEEQSAAQAIFKASLPAKDVAEDTVYTYTKDKDYPDQTCLLYTSPSPRD